MTTLTKQSKQEKVMMERVDRDERALDAVGTPEAKAVQEELSLKVMAYNHAKAGAEQADQAEKAGAGLEEADRELGVVLGSVYFMVREFDHAHLAKLPPASEFAHTEPGFMAARLLPLLREGDKYSHLAAELLGRAVEKKAHAEERVRKAGEHDRRAADKLVAARKELTAVLMKAEAFVHLETGPDHPARALLKRPRKASPAKPAPAPAPAPVPVAA